MSSHIPLGGALVEEVLKSFTRKPPNGDDSWEDCSIGVAKDSIVATDSYSAIVIGRDADSHVATMRKEVVIECTRAKQYGEPVAIDDIHRNIDQSSGEAKPMPNALGEIRKRLAGMRSIAAIKPEALVAIGKVAARAGASSVELLQPERDELGEFTSVGFRFVFLPDTEHMNLFSTWEGPIEARGVFIASKGEKRTETEETLPETEVVEESAEPAAPKKGRGRRTAAAPAELEPSPEVVEEVVPETPAVPPIDHDAVIERDGYRLPALSLLAIPDATPPQSGDYGNRIINQLRAFNLQGRIIGTHTGPRITQYELEIPSGVKAERYEKLAADLQLQLAVPSVKIAPIPGKSALGVEIPNAKAQLVGLRNVCATHEFLEAKSALTFALGESINGTPVYGDLTKMPHLLIGGATNSGKSIGVASLITSLLMRNTPKQLRFVMIDPKRVELTLFDSIPHLMCPVIRDMKEAPGVLRAVWREMDRRYELLSNEGCRNIDGWNAKASFQDRMPYIVVVIDELADLMMQAAAEVEHIIVRLAQMARAVGIHLVVATQRPSVDVVTGLIKTNIPSRIAFNVASGIDSRVILDSVGAEKLLGQGDMLYSPIGENVRRVQGAFVSESEIDAICSFWRSIEQPQYTLELVEDTKDLSGTDEPDDDGQDPMFKEAALWVAERGQASTSMLQRKYSIGFQRASKLLDQMEARKVVGPRDGPRPREVLMSSVEISDL